MPGFSLTTALLIGSLATTATGTAVAVRGARRAGKAGQAAAEADATLSDYNADVAELQAADALERGEIEANRYRQSVRALVGGQRAAYAAQGVDVNSGSPLEVQEDTRAIGELDALQLVNNAKREAWGFKVEAYDSRMRAFYARREGVMLAKAGTTAALSAGLQGAGGALAIGSNYAAMRYGFQQPGTVRATYTGDALLPAVPRA